MKKNLFFIAAGFISCLAINTTAQAQTPGVKDETQKTMGRYDADAASASGFFMPGNANVIHAKAARNFAKYFKTATDVKWFEATGGYRAKFETAGVETWVDYDRNGNWRHTIRVYDEKKLPPEIRHVVKSSYYDHTIKFVHEIELPGIPQNTICYIIHLENEQTLLDLRLYDGEMEIIKELVKK